MYSPRAKLQCPPKEYSFPYAPYAIQQQLMDSLYSVLENKKIAIFESPTGTGKSLTLTCAALRWLEDHEALKRKDLEERLKEVEVEIEKLERDCDKATDWISTQYKALEHKQELRELRLVREKLENHEERLNELRKRQGNIKDRKEMRRRQRGTQARDKEKCQEKMDSLLEGEDELIEAEHFNDLEEDETSTEHQQRYKEVQIFFCSRTHSQLAQVVRELKRTAYSERIRCVSLASRQQLCIHPQLSRLNNVSLINERCLDMAKSKKKDHVANWNSVEGCTKKKPRIPASSPLPLGSCNLKSQDAVENLSEIALTEVLDIEDLVTEGGLSKACPYYAARLGAQRAQLVMLPYQLLLHRRTRIQSGITLQDSVVIIDEAHNLLETLAQLHSCELNMGQLQAVQLQIVNYKMKYSKRFCAANLLKINQLLYIIKRLLKMLSPRKEPTSRMLRTYELTAEGEFFNIDLFQLLKFCERTRFAQKLQGFAQRSRGRENQVPQDSAGAQAGSHNAVKSLLQHLQSEHLREQNPKAKAKSQCDSKETPGQVFEKPQNLHPNVHQAAQASAIRSVLAFLEALTEDAEDGRVLISTDPLSCFFKYIVLNPGVHFADIMREARAVIVAGGTMQPLNELTEQLFHAQRERVEVHCYDHVVPKDAVLPFVVSRGCTGKALSFKYDQRGKQEMINELCMSLQNICSVVPAGVVCFLPSYDYLDLVYGALESSGTLERISIYLHKKVFRESRSESAEQLLFEYSQAIKNPNFQGALLLSVVGGKLSEGLNFADDLGRAVIVVGMPYPNRNSPEIQERMKYLDATLGLNAGQEFYENLCMKAVNQCIGRVVRHIRDYACVFLLDERYANDRIQKKLPQWIARNLEACATFGQMQAKTARFFRSKRQNREAYVKKL